MNNPAKAASVDDNQIFPRKSDFVHQMRRTKKRTFGYFCFNRQKCPQRSGRMKRYKTRCESKRQHKRNGRRKENPSSKSKHKSTEPKNPHKSEIKPISFEYLLLNNLNRKI